MKIKRQNAVISDIARNGARRAAVADLQCAGADRGAAAIGVGIGHDERSRPHLRQCAGARDRPVKAHRVGAVEGENAVVRDIADNRAPRAAVAELERASGDRCTPGIALVGGQNEDASAHLLQRASPGNHTAECDAVRTVERQDVVVDHIADDRACGPAIAELERTRRDRGAAGVAVSACDDQRPEARLLHAA